MEYIKYVGSKQLEIGVRWNIKYIIEDLSNFGEDPCWRLIDYEYGIAGTACSLKIFAKYDENKNIKLITCTYDPAIFLKREIELSENGGIMLDSITLENPLAVDCIYRHIEMPNKSLDYYVNQEEIGAKPEEYFGNEHTYVDKIRGGSFKNVLFEDKKIENFLEIAKYVENDFNSHEDLKESIDSKEFVKHLKRK